MTKIRVHEYAKKVNRTSKEVIDELGKINVSVTNHMSTIRYRMRFQNLINHLAEKKLAKEHRKRTCC